MSDMITVINSGHIYNEITQRSNIKFINRMFVQLCEDVRRRCPYNWACMCRFPWEHGQPIIDWLRQRVLLQPGT